MAGSRNPEGAVNAIISLLGSNLATKLSDLDDATFTLADLAEIYRAPLMAYRRFPCAVVVASDNVLPPRLRKSSMHEFSVLVQVFIRENGKYTYEGRTIGPAEACTIRLYRTMEAVQNVIQDAPRLTVSSVDYCNRCFVEDIAYGPTDQPNEQQQLFFKSAVMSLNISTNPSP